LEIAIASLSAITVMWSFILAGSCLSGQVKTFDSLGYTSKNFDCEDLAIDLLDSHWSSKTFVGTRQRCMPPNIYTPHPTKESLGYRYFFRLIESQRNIFFP